MRSIKFCVKLCAGRQLFHTPTIDKIVGLSILALTLLQEMQNHCHPC